MLTVCVKTRLFIALVERKLTCIEWLPLFLFIFAIYTYYVAPTSTRATIIISLVTSSAHGHACFLRLCMYALKYTEFTKPTLHKMFYTCRNPTKLMLGINTAIWMDYHHSLPVKVDQHSGLNGLNHDVLAVKQ